jgi:hypothetical protein
MTTESIPQSLTVVVSNQKNQTLEKLSQATRIQSLSEFNFVSKAKSAKNYTQARLIEEALGEKSELQVQQKCIEASLALQNNALNLLKQLFTAQHSPSSSEAELLWASWLGFAKHELDKGHTIYTQEYMALTGQASYLEHYLPARFTKAQPPNPEELRQMLGFWVEQEITLKQGLQENTKRSNRLEVMLENLYAVNPSIDPNQLIKKTN